MYTVSPVVGMLICSNAPVLVILVDPGLLVDRPGKTMVHGTAPFFFLWFDLVSVLSWCSQYNQMLELIFSQIRNFHVQSPNKPYKEKGKIRLLLLQFVANISLKL